MSRRLLKTPRVLEVLCEFATSAPQPGYDVAFRVEGDDDARGGNVLGQNELERLPERREEW